jgi:endonuclease YncB( thermonuclease family)
VNGTSGLPLHRPRRIFRAAALPLPGRHVLMPLSLGVLAAIVAAGVVLAVMSSDLFGRAPAPAGQVAAEPAQIAVVDADTLRLSDRVVRLSGISVPARGETCRDAQGQNFDCGVAAANALAALVREAPVDCQLRGADGMGRAFAVCEAGGRELNRALVDAGWARADNSSPALEAAETTARDQRRGLWASGENSW